jgi:hypothetical protein
MNCIEPSPPSVVWCLGRAGVHVSLAVKGLSLTFTLLVATLQPASRMTSVWTFAGSASGPEYRISHGDEQTSWPSSETLAPSGSVLIQNFAEARLAAGFGNNAMREDGSDGGVGWTDVAGAGAGRDADVFSRSLAQATSAAQIANPQRMPES